jgi:hypothetical protein
MTIAASITKELNDFSKAIKDYFTGVKTFVTSGGSSPSYADFFPALNNDTLQSTALKGVTSGFTSSYGVIPQSAFEIEAYKREARMISLTFSDYHDQYSSDIPKIISFHNGESTRLLNIMTGKTPSQNQSIR